jgi:hypothetical protein
MKRVFLLIAFVPFTLFAQTRIDSLKTAFKTMKNDTNKVNTLWTLGWEYVFSNPDTTLILGKQAYSLAKKLKLNKGEAMIYNLVGTAYAIKSNFPKAHFYFKKCLAIAVKNNDKPWQKK